MKNYLNFEGLSYFIDILLAKFAAIGHTHTKSEIIDFSEKEIVVEDDGNGNVILSFKTE